MEIARQNANHGLRIDARTAATRWGGERMDYGVAIDSLVYRTRKAAASGGSDGRDSHAVDPAGAAVPGP